MKEFNNQNIMVCHDCQSFYCESIYYHEYMKKIDYPRSCYECRGNNQKKNAMKKFQKIIDKAKNPFAEQ